MTTETKAQKFTRLAEARVSRSLDDIRLIGQLVARTYEHTPDQAEKIVTALTSGVSDVARTFAVPFTSRIGKAGKIDATPGIFADTRSPAHVETSHTKIAIAKALDMLKTGNAEGAQAILTDLL